MRVERIGEATLYLGDCREILPTLGPVDALVTDPPYGLDDWNNRGSNAARPFDSEQTQEWDQPVDAALMALILGCAKYHIIWGANHLLDHLGRTKQMLVWNKGIRKMHFNDCELAWCSQWREACRMFDLSPSAAEAKDHPTQKPLALMRWCIDMLPDAAETVVDPFMGAGTTGVACIELEHPFIGIEMLPKYFDVACRRMEEANRQPRLFRKPASAPVQLSIF